MVLFPPKRRGRPPGKIFDFNINLPLTKEMVRLVEGALLPKQSRCEFIRRAIDKALSPESPETEPGRAEPRRKRRAVGGKHLTPAASPPLAGRE
jgi:hypothetical protein